MLLVVAATQIELAPEMGDADRVERLVCGIGPVEAALSTAAALERAGRAPAAVINVGIAGCRRGCGLEPGAIVLGAESVYDDLAPTHLAPTRILADPALLEQAREALPEAHVVPIGTSAAVAGSRGPEVEAMEGFAVLRCAERAGVPALELRVVSNEIEEGDRARWKIDEAIAILHEATVRLVSAIA